MALPQVLRPVQAGHPRRVLLLFLQARIQEQPTIVVPPRTLCTTVAVAEVTRRRLVLLRPTRAMDGDRRATVIPLRLLISPRHVRSLVRSSLKWTERVILYEAGPPPGSNSGFPYQPPGMHLRLRSKTISAHHTSFKVLLVR